MPSFQNGSVRLFRFAGIDLFLHWSWFVVAAYEINGGFGAYSSNTWKALEYLSLFLIVMLHEFGHALACRQVGGNANRIVLWPLGGVAYVDPPPRPGATLWSIAAGPLVNVALVPILTGLGFLSRHMGWSAEMPNAHALLRAVWFINLSLLIFNMLPIYPLGRADPSSAALVCARARSQFNVNHLPRLCWSGWADCSCHLDAVHVVWHCCGVHLDELLERTAAGAGIIAIDKVAASHGIGLSLLQDGAATRELLEVQHLQLAL